MIKCLPVHFVIEVPKHSQGYSTVIHILLLLLYSHVFFDSLFNYSLFLVFIFFPILRCRIDAQFGDSSGTLGATLFAENAERILNYTAEQLMQHTVGVILLT